MYLKNPSIAATESKHELISSKPQISCEAVHKKIRIKPSNQILLTSLMLMLSTGVYADKPMATWKNLGPSSIIVPSIPELLASTGDTTTYGGRATALEIGSKCDKQFCRLWVGNAGGGIWRTDDALNTKDVKWQYQNVGLSTNAIGAIVRDPNDSSDRTLYVGTGESNFTMTSEAGSGLFKSIDGGNSYSKIPTMIYDSTTHTVIDFTSTRAISAVAVKPGDSNTLYVTTTNAMHGMTAVRSGQAVLTGLPQPTLGLYKTTDGGATWSLIFAPTPPAPRPLNPNLSLGNVERMEGAKDVKLDPLDPNTVYVTSFDNGIYRSSPSLESGDASFKLVFALTGADPIGEFNWEELPAMALTVKNGHTRIYAGNGVNDLNYQALYRTDNANLPASQLVIDGPVPTNNPANWTLLTSTNPNDPGYTSYDYCDIQCSYDQVLVTPKGQPDTLLVGGEWTFTYMTSTIRSTNAGASFNAFNIDAQPVPTVGHVDAHAIVFHPQNPAIAFVGSDGGVIRSNGTFKAAPPAYCNSVATLSFGNFIPAVCNAFMSNVPEKIYSLNQGLQTSQFFGLAVDPKNPLKRIMGGIQDSGVVLLDGSYGKNVWTLSLSQGDGAPGLGFHSTKPNIVFASLNSKFLVTSFRGGKSIKDWTATGAPLFNSGETGSVSPALFGARALLTLDPTQPDTQYTGYQHIWRTQNNGGDQAFLEANCSDTVRDFWFNNLNPACGDWKPLGVAYPFDPDSDLSSPSRLPGDLTSTFYGNDRTGGIITTVARSQGDNNTLWATTNKGRVFVSKNGNSADASQVSFTRIDNLVANSPDRFVSGLIVDSNNPNRAWISYAGYNTLNPSLPGHVFEVVYNTTANTASWQSIDDGLPDQPINTIARDNLTGDLYSATDSEVLVHYAGSHQWVTAGKNLPLAMIPSLVLVSDKRLLFAATHGLGVWVLDLPKVKK